MLYKEVANKIRQSIITGRYPVNSKLPHVPFLCQEYSVSSITIRKALNILRDQGYIRRQQHVGTTVISDNPQRESAGEGLPVVAFILTGFNDSFGTKIVESALETARQQAHMIIKLTDGEESLENDAIDSSIAAGAQGLILMPCNSTYIPNKVLSLVTQGFPVTTIDRSFQGIPLATVTSNNVQGAQEATESLIALGHQHIAFISSISNVTSNNERHAGWEMAHARNNIILDEQLEIRTINFNTDHKQSEQSAVNNIEILDQFICNHPQVTAYLVGEYRIALLLRTALKNHGKAIPKDVSVICFDHSDAPYDDSIFRFTYVLQNQRKLGTEAVQETLDQIRNGANSKHLVVPTRIVKGKSTAKLMRT